MKTGIKLQIAEVEWLAAVLQKITTLAPIKDFELASVTLAELYVKNLKNFIMPKEFTLSMKQSDGMALKQMLMELGTVEEYSIFMVNFIVAKVEEFEYANLLPKSLLKEGLLAQETTIDY